MILNNKLLETMTTCVKKNGECSGCFYGDGEDKPNCMLHLMNDMLFFFGNPVPSETAKVLSLEELEEALSDRKDHLSFAEYISSIHVPTPVIRTVKMSGNIIDLYDPNTDTHNQVLKTEYYTKFRVWSTKPTDKLRNATPWVSIDGHTDEEQPETSTKTTNLLRYIHNMTSNA